MSKHHVPRLHQLGKWMPSSHSIHRDWLGEIITHVDQNPRDLHPVLVEFQDLIESNTRVYLLISSMFEEIPHKKPYSQDPIGNPQIRDYPHLLQVLNHLLTTAPSWSDDAHRVRQVGLPIHAVLDWPMGTPSGYAAFLDPEVNKMIKKILNAWGEFLRSEESAVVLNDSETGWFGNSGRECLALVGNVGHDNGTFDPAAHSPFETLFVCDPSAKYHGFTSWDDFFTRQFKPEVRPVAAPDDSRVIANAYESQPYKVAHDVKGRDRFWVKGQPYSVIDMLAHDSLATHFIGGTVYQAFLSALSYHRWHAPITGRIVKAYVVDGTYYSEPLFEGVGNPQAHKQDIDMTGEVTAQEFMTATATRAVIFIESDDPAVGLVAFLGVGLTEVSTCDITVKEGEYIRKGDQLGMFHYGGSTYCLLFRKEVKLEGFPNPDINRNVFVRSRLAVVK
ncbi:hypothetical protein MW887_005559 [Aspergillus wentii]|nr:hypothetical protein MW887_005559 [Aspergillus wentii]